MHDATRGDASSSAMLVRRAGIFLSRWMSGLDRSLHAPARNKTRPVRLSRQKSPRDVTMTGFTGPNGRRYEARNRWVALGMIGASMVGVMLGWLRLRKKK
jgi:hypothetical protein